MRLLCDREWLSRMNRQNLCSAIEECRAVIRRHRGQRGDNRCWLDDWSVWVMLSDTPEPPKQPPPFEKAMRLCREFWTHRRAETVDSAPADANFVVRTWDDDLPRMGDSELLTHLILVLEAIRLHRDAPLSERRPRTIDDDRRLYAVLPEKVSADFRLPTESEFLGEALSPYAGCPAFWRSHASCPVKDHDLHTWGPCKS